jgi:hypothetical protein
MILLLDPHPWPAWLWVAAGCAVGLFGFRAFRPFAEPLAEWYLWRNTTVERELRIATLAMDERAIETEEIKEWKEQQEFRLALVISPLAGLFHGTLAGGIVGALCGLDSDLDVSASTGAALGVLVGPAIVALAAGAAMASVVHLSRELPLRVRLVRRGVLLISAVYIIPAIWHCLKTMCRSGLRSLGR